MIIIQVSWAAGDTTRWRYQAKGPGTETIDGIFSISDAIYRELKRFNLTVNVAGNG